LLETYTIFQFSNAYCIHTKLQTFGVAEFVVVVDGGCNTGVDVLVCVVSSAATAASAATIPMAAAGVAWA
jgi:hypothetical protein